MTIDELKKALADSEIAYAAAKVVADDAYKLYDDAWDVRYEAQIALLGALKEKRND